MTTFWRKTNFKAVHVAAFFLSLCATLSSCKKYEDEIGFDLLPNTDQFKGQVTDSFEIRTYAVREDSIRVDSLSSTILGAINDPVFGTTSSSVYTQCLLQEINIDFGTNPSLDSVVLSIALDGDIPGYGDVNSNVTVDVFQLQELLNEDNRYYSNYQPAVGSLLGTYTGKLNPDDTTWFNENGTLQKERGLIRIKLSQAFGESFFTAGAYGSNESFLNFLNGIALVPRSSGLSSGSGYISPLDLNSSLSKLSVYFSDTLKKEFPITDQSERMMHYSISDPSTNLTNQFNSPGTHFDETYLQSMGMSKIKIEIPDLFELVKDGEQILINEAKLTLTVANGSATETYPAPERILLLQPVNADGTGSNKLILDLIDLIAPPSSAWSGYTNYGGELNSDGRTYTFHLNRHLQGLLDDAVLNGNMDNRGLYVIIPSDNPITPSRLVLDTKNNQTEKNIRLKVTYTKL